MEGNVVNFRLDFFRSKLNADRRLFQSGVINTLNFVSWRPDVSFEEILEALDEFSAVLEIVQVQVRDEQNYCDVYSADNGVDPVWFFARLPGARWCVVLPVLLAEVRVK